MEQIELNLLKAGIQGQHKVIMKLFDEIEERRKGASRNKFKLESLCYKLHNLYSAIEDLFRIIARYFENKVDDVARYHKELLKRMTLEIKGVRPALLSEDTFKALDELRSFRHFFIHSYEAELQYEKVKPVLKKVDQLKLVFLEDIDTFLKELGA